MKSDCSQSQVNSDRALVDLGLLLTQKIFSTKTKLKQINPTLIYEWDGQTLSNMISGKGIFKVRNSLSNQIIFECQVNKWKSGVPQGNIIMKKINFFSNTQFGDYKVKQVQTYEGNSSNLKKHGQGSYTFQQFYSSGRVKKTNIIGQWNNDILIKGNVQTDNIKKQLNLTKNVQWSKSTKSIMLEPQSEYKIKQIQPKQNLKKLKDQRDSNLKPIFKQTTNMYTNPPSQSNTLLSEFPEQKYTDKYLDPVKLR